MKGDAMPKKILLIDDEPEIVELIGNRLRANQFDVVTAADGLQGLERAKDQKPDLIILDVGMPNMDGYTFVQEFKKIDELRSIPIIILTAKTHVQSLFKSEGITDCFLKPFDTLLLLSRIKDILK